MQAQVILISVDERSSYLITFSCTFCRYRYIGLPFSSPSRRYVLKKIDEIFSAMPDVFSIADNILIAGFYKQKKDNERTSYKVILTFRQANLRLYKDKHPFRCNHIYFFGKVVSWQGVSLDLRKAPALRGMLPPQSKKNCSYFWMN